LKTGQQLIFEVVQGFNYDSLPYFVLNLFYNSRPKLLESNPAVFELKESEFIALLQKIL